MTQVWSSVFKGVGDARFEARSEARQWAIALACMWGHSSIWRMLQPVGPMPRRDLGLTGDPHARKF